MKYEAIVIGVSPGGLNVMKQIFAVLPVDFCLPLIIVQHVGPHSDGQWIDILNNMSFLNIKEADEKETITKGHIYIAPPNYHLLIEKDKTFSLTIDERVNYARPSIDVLFESAAEVYQEKLIGIILTGANNDGAMGLKKIKNFGGLTIVQNPETSESAYMPQSAITAQQPDHILSTDKIIDLLIQISKSYML